MRGMADSVGSFLSCFCEGGNLGAGWLGFGFSVAVVTGTRGNVMVKIPPSNLARIALMIQLFGISKSC